MKPSRMQVRTLRRCSRPKAWPSSWQAVLRRVAELVRERVLRCRLPYQAMLILGS